MIQLRLKRSEPVNAEPPLPAIAHGLLTEWNDERGYGFLTPDDGGKRVFLHVKSLCPSARRPVVGENFVYTLSSDEKGRPRAIDACQTDLSRHRRAPFGHSLVFFMALLFPFSVVLPVIMMAAVGNVLAGLVPAFFVNSLFTFLFYWEDKFRAQYKYYRIPEKILHWWEFLCGWPGALFAQRVFHHKCRKPSYNGIFWCCAVLNVILLCCLLFFTAPANWDRLLRFLWQTLSNLKN